MNAKDETHRMLDNAIEVYTDSARTFSQEEVEDAYTNLWDAIDLHAAACVAEARAPLAEALQLVEWIDCVVGDGEDEDSWRECAYCRNQREQGHHRDCPIAAALAKGETP